MPERKIPCPDGCPPGRARIGPLARTVRWEFTPQGNGVILDVTGLPDPPFSNGRRDGDDYLIDYAGDTDPPVVVWPYQLTSDPACPAKGKQEEPDPELTNEPEGL